MVIGKALVVVDLMFYRKKLPIKFTVIINPTTIISHPKPFVQINKNAVNRVVAYGIRIIRIVFTGCYIAVYRII